MVKYFSKIPSRTNCLFLTLPSSNVRANSQSDFKLYRDFVLRLSNRDLQNFQILGYNFQFEIGIGITFFLDAFSRLLIKFYKHESPNCLLQIRLRRNNTNEQLAAIQQRIHQHETPQLRVLASHFLTDFLEEFQKLLDGEGPTEYGQSLQEEIDIVGNWDSSRISLREKEYIQDLDSELRTKELRLFGAPQFERLLDEFQFVTSHIIPPQAKKESLSSFLNGNSILAVKQKIFF